MAELEELIERYRTFAANATLSTPTDRSELRKLLKKTHKVLGPPPESHDTDDSETSAMAATFRQAAQVNPKILRQL